ncbi:hypothetical protein LXL04_018638, partial [Taraxacum kok-saghyz]
MLCTRRNSIILVVKDVFCKMYGITLEEKHLTLPQTLEVKVLHILCGGRVPEAKETVSQFEDFRSDLINIFQIMKNGKTEKIEAGILEKLVKDNISTCNRCVLY